MTKLDSEPVDWLYDPWIERNAFTLFTGEGGSGKSWLALDLAIAVASGQSWLGYGGRDRMPVIVLDQDTGENITKRRLSMLCRGRNLEPAFLRETLFTLPRCGFKVDNNDHLKWLVEEARGRGVRYIVADALVALHSADENEAQQMAEVLRGRFGALMASTGAGLAIIHHMNKPNENHASKIHRVRGSGEIVNSSDCMISFSKSDGMTRMELERSRSAAEEDWPLPITYAVDRDTDPTCAVIAPKANLKVASAIDAIKSANLANLSTRDCHAALKSAGFSFSHSTIARALKRAKRP